MALDAVVKDILATSTSQVAEINAETDSEVAGILSEARDRAAEITSRKEAEAESAVEALERREISSAHLELKRAELNLRKELLEQTNVKLFDALSKLSKKNNEALLKKLVEPYDLKEMRVTSNEKNKAFVSSLAPNYGSEIDTIGGVVIESMDGLMSYDLTYETLAREVFNRSLKDVSKILFG